MIAVRTSSEVDAARGRSITVSAPYFTGQAQLGHLFHQGRKPLGKAPYVGIHLATLDANADRHRLQVLGD